MSILCNSYDDVAPPVVTDHKIIRNRRGDRNAWSREVLAMLGVKRLPPEGMPERLIQGVRVYVKPGVSVRPLRERAKALRSKMHWHMARAGSGGSWHMAAEYSRQAEELDRQARKSSRHRVMAICGCGRHVSVGRLHQHVCRCETCKGPWPCSQPWCMAKRATKETE